ncbi:uncharacterized [Tachysurus ichikawai]
MWTRTFSEHENRSLFECDGKKGKTVFLKRLKDTLAVIVRTDPEREERSVGTLECLCSEPQQTLRRRTLTKARTVIFITTNVGVCAVWKSKPFQMSCGNEQSNSEQTSTGLTDTTRCRPPGHLISS